MRRCVLRLLCAPHYARRSEFPSLTRWKRPSAPGPPRPCAVSAGRSLLACALPPLCEAASPAAQEPDAVAVFLVQICCHLDDQNRNQTVTPGTSQVGIFLLLLVHQCVTTETGAGSAFAGCCDIGWGEPDHLHRREDALQRRLFRRMGGCYRWAFNGKNMVGEQLLRQQRTGAFFHSRTPRPSRQRRQVRPPDRLTGAHIQPSPGQSLFTDMAACVHACFFFFFFLREATG